MNQPDLFRCGGMYQKMPPPFFPWPYDPTVNPWVKYGPVSPGMVPYHQYFAPHIHAPMSPGTMANVSPFLMMHQMHPPPVHHTLQSGAPVIGKPGQIPPMDQHQLNPGQINGAQQLQPQLMPGNHPAAPPETPENSPRTHVHSGQRQLFNMARSPAGLQSVPPPSVPNVPTALLTEMNGDALEKFVAKSTLSINAKPFVYAGASIRRPLPHVEEVHRPPRVVVPSPVVVAQEPQPTHQAATTTPKTPEVAETPTATAVEITTIGTPVVSANVDRPSVEVRPCQQLKKQPVVQPHTGMDGDAPDIQDTDTISEISSAESTLSFVAEPCVCIGDRSNHPLSHIEEAPQPAAVVVSSPAVVALEQSPQNKKKTVPHKTPEAIQVQTGRMEAAEERPVDMKVKTTGLEKLSVKEQPEVAVRRKNRKKKKHRKKRVENEPDDTKAPVLVTDTATILDEQQNLIDTADYNAVSPKENDDQQQIHSGQSTPPKQLVISTPVVTVEVLSKEPALEAVEQPTKAPILAPAPLANVQESTLGPIKKPRSLIEYNPDQWSPHNLSGKKKYSFVQLLHLKNSPHSLKKMSNLSKCVEIVLGRSSHGPAHITRSDNRYGKKNRTEASLLPTFMRMGDRGGSGFNMANQIRPSQQGAKIVRLQLNEVELTKCENAWRPRHLQHNEVLNEEERNTQELFKRFRSILNKLTPENFVKLVKQVHTFVINNDERLNGCINLVFEKAISEPTFSETYAKMCKEVGTVAVVVISSEQKPISFKNRLITRCQAEFEQRRIDQNSATRNLRIQLKANRNLDKEKFDDLKTKLEEEEQKVRRRAVGTIRFIGELYKAGQLTSNIMHICIKLLLAEDARGYNEETLECLCKLLTTIGSKIENENHQDLSSYFQKMDQIVRDKDRYRISSRIRFMIQDVIDLRCNGWKPRRQELKPKTIDEIQDEAQKDQTLNTTNYRPSRGGGGDVGHRGGSNMQGGFRKAVSTVFSGVYDQGRLRSPDAVVPKNRSQLQMDPNRFNIPSNLETTRLGSAASYQGWKNNSSMFAPLNKDDSRTDGYGNRKHRDRYRNGNIVCGDSYHKGTMMEHNRYNQYDSSGRQNDERAFRSSRELSSSVRITPTKNSRPSNDQMHDRIVQQQQSTIHGRSSEQRYIPLSLGSPPAGRMGPPCMPPFAMPKSVAVRQNFPLPDRETEIKIQKIVKSVNIEMDQSDIEAGAAMLKDLNIPAEYYHAAISQLLIDNIERDVKSREIVVKVIAVMFEMKLIVKTDYLHALEQLFKLADDLLIDLPQLYRYVATFYVMLLNKRCINLVDVLNAAKEILPKYGASMVTQLLLQYEAVYGKDATVMLWHELSLSPNDFSADKAEKYLTDANLSYLLDSKIHESLTKSLEIKYIT
ncbi:eukaryotic translation initiation factor 4 gamma 3-like [Ochlerotatus camptorhynchus]|uniref:eukaryotic translation initiation factor 4 gamma 3-like n=1 Tax=Ochlerotatus camptorhynchus TaxID=644619 RepID=UPI0031D43143